MSVKIKRNSLYLRDKNNVLLPIGLICSSSDADIEDMKRYKEQAVSELSDKGDEILLRFTRDYVIPEEFGAVGDGVTDDSAAINSALAYMKDNDKHILVLPHSYFIKSTIHLFDMEDITIYGGHIIANESLLNMNTFEYIHIEWCRGVTVYGTRFTNIATSDSNYSLYHGGIFIDHTTMTNITNVKMNNTMAGVILFNYSSKCTVRDCKISNDRWNRQASSGILVYASSDNIISDNDIQGIFYDGTLSIFGSGSDNNKVLNNKVISANGDTVIPHLPQGITIDSGCNNTIVQGNHVYRMYYGIDNKNDTRNTLISNNVVSGCKVGIADRTGDDSEHGDTYRCKINDNVIMLSDTISILGLSDFLKYGYYYFIGILSEGRSSINIQNNSIFFNGMVEKRVLGIDTSNYSIPNDLYMGVSQVSNNVIDFAGGIGDKTYTAYSGSTAIMLYNLNKCIVSNNSFRVWGDNFLYQMFKAQGKLNGIMLSNNLMYGTNSTYHKFYEDSTISSDNMLNSSNFAPHCMMSIPF